MKLAQSIDQQLDALKKEKTNLFSPLETIVSHEHFVLMSKASLELLDLIKEASVSKHLLNDKPKASQHFAGNLSAMIGVDFHITPEGPRIIEINTNAGGLVTSALWAHRNQPEQLEQVLQKMVAMFQSEHMAWCRQKGKENPLQHIAIIDENPAEEYTYHDFLLTAEVFKTAGIEVSIGRTKDLYVQEEKIYLPSTEQPIDLIYNRDCDFYLQAEESSILHQTYVNALACVSPNPYGYGLLSDKSNLATLYTLIQDEQLSGKYPALAETLLPTYTLQAFLEKGLNRNDWYFKPINEHAGKGVYRGKKLSQKRLDDMDVANHIVQQEALPDVIHWQGDEYKYDLRLFVYDDVIEISSRIYQGRITNFRTENGGYSTVKITQ